MTYYYELTNWTSDWLNLDWNHSLIRSPQVMPWYLPSWYDLPSLSVSCSQLSMTKCSDSSDCYWLYSLLSNSAFFSPWDSQPFYWDFQPNSHSSYSKDFQPFSKSGNFNPYCSRTCNLHHQCTSAILSSGDDLGGATLHFHSYLLVDAHRYGYVAG